MNAEELESCARRLKESVARVPALRSVEVNPYTRRAIFSFDDNALGIAELTRLVDDAERGAGVEAGAYNGEHREHPSDVEPAQRLVFELVADTLGFVIGTTLRFSPLPASNLAASAAAALAIVGATPRLRRGFDERLGSERTDMVLNLASSMALGFAQRPGSALVEAVHKSVLLREAQARRRIWHEREHDLCAQSIEHRFADVRGDPRPRPLPRGRIDEYGDRAWMVSLAGFAVSVLATRSVQRSVAAVFPWRYVVRSRIEQ